MVRAKRQYLMKLHLKILLYLWLDLYVTQAKHFIN